MSIEDCTTTICMDDMRVNEIGGRGKAESVLEYRKRKIPSWLRLFIRYNNFFFVHLHRFCCRGVILC